MPAYPKADQAKRKGGKPPPVRHARSGSTLKSQAKGIAKVSRRRAIDAAARSDLRPSWFIREGVCEAVKRGAVHRCWTGLTVHEAHTRARSGGLIDDPRTWFTLCAEVNRLVSQDAGWQEWAEAEGLLFSAHDGDEWLRAGGRFPGMTRDQAVAEVKSWGPAAPPAVREETP